MTLLQTSSVVDVLGIWTGCPSICLDWDMEACLEKVARPPRGRRGGGGCAKLMCGAKGVVKPWEGRAWLAAHRASGGTWRPEQTQRGLDWKVQCWTIGRVSQLQTGQVDQCWGWPLQTARSRGPSSQGDPKSCKQQACLSKSCNRRPDVFSHLSLPACRSICNAAGRTSEYLMPFRVSGANPVTESFHQTPRSRVQMVFVSVRHTCQC